jgi:hypothetical protein
MGQTAPTSVRYSAPHIVLAVVDVYLLGPGVRRLGFAEDAPRRLGDERLTVLEALMDAELVAGEHALGDFARFSRLSNARVVSFQRKGDDIDFEIGAGGSSGNPPRRPRLPDVRRAGSDFGGMTVLRRRHHQRARIEPRAPEAEMYVTHPFAALAALAGDRAFACQYVGTLPTAKGYR